MSDVKPESAKGKAKPKASKPVVVSSLTGKPMELSQKPGEVIPKRAKEDVNLDARDTDSNTERLLREVPPHW